MSRHHVWTGMRLPKAALLTSETDIPKEWLLLPTTRKDAFSQNETRYFTGKQCKHGHIAIRYVHSGCAACRNKICANSYRNKPENQKKARQQSRQWYQENTNRQKKHSARRRKTNPVAVLAECANRRALKLQAIPKWVDKKDVYRYLIKLYTTAKQLEQETGVAHQIDHIVPLKGKTVCGLHCPENLQILTAVENGLKSNNLIEAYLPKSSQK